MKKVERTTVWVVRDETEQGIRTPRVRVWVRDRLDSFVRRMAAAVRAGAREARLRPLL